MRCYGLADHSIPMPRHIAASHIQLLRDDAGAARARSTQIELEVELARAVPPYRVFDLVFDLPNTLLHVTANILTL